VNTSIRTCIVCVTSPGFRNTELKVSEKAPFVVDRDSWDLLQAAMLGETTLINSGARAYRDVKRCDLHTRSLFMLHPSRFQGNRRHHMSIDIDSFGEDCNECGS
jgi:hypothetical protein